MIPQPRMLCKRPYIHITWPVDPGRRLVADAVLWTGKVKPKLTEEGSFHDRFAKLRPAILQGAKDSVTWTAESQIRPEPQVLGRALARLD